MNLLQNTPITCRNCNALALGKEYPARQADGSLLSECHWRCSKCGTFLKRGFTKILEPAKTSNETK